MARRSSDPGLAPTSDFLSALRQRGNDLKEQFRGKPVQLAESFGLTLPEKPVIIMERLGKYDPDRHGPIQPGLRELVEDVCYGDTRSAAVVGPRGGGKSQGVSFIEFYLFMIEDYDALNLGGSELQADQVYQYLLSYIEHSEYWRELIKGDPLQSKTTNKVGAWIRVLTASSKSVRSPHAGGRKRDGRIAGGLLVIDEEAEAEAEIVEAALPTINTARPSVNVRSSTFHNAVGSFADLIDNYESMGYSLYKWDIFDVCEGCECTGDECEHEEKCFREDHKEIVIDPVTGEENERLIHRAYCGGRARYANGWIPMEEVTTLWKRMKRNHNRWEVEAMGSRPSTTGYVIRDKNALAINKTERSGEELYVPGSPVTVCIDWGTVGTGLTVWQEQFGDRHALLEAELIEDAGESAVFGALLNQVNKYRSEFKEIAADIGGGGNYLNRKLREELRLPVRDVNFNEEKEQAVSAWNMLNEAEQCDYPAEFTAWWDQVGRWRRTKQGRIQKGNDHLMDSSICYFAQFIERLSPRKIRVSPQTFHSVVGQVPEDRQNAASHRRPARRVALVRGLGSGRRR